MTKIMNKNSFYQLAGCIFLCLQVWVECLPSTPTTPGSDQSTEADRNLAKTMGKLFESNCHGNIIRWDKDPTNSPWGKFQLADSLNLYLNIWQNQKVLDGGKSDILCSRFRKGDLVWKTKFDMPSAPQDNNQVKAYTNVAWVRPETLQLKNVKVFNSVWDWKLSEQSQDLVADVSYDIFLSKDPGCKEQTCASREIMIWLSAIGGAKPAGQKQGTIKIGSEYEFQVWQGTAGVPVVSIFPAQENRKFDAFKGDFKDIIQKLGQFGVSQDEFIVSVGAGIEIFKGKGELATPSTRSMCFETN
ncbi:hypothetical protein PSTT_13220 [Puccinia striiformis]|uniref:Uncharacterized protein n=1 Tax=Puccinia striiformis TaxID=27350 RepID=A0A2S4USQ1_9BASI|nr:hypothetical protein PSTT_13220 [Puccinia striiformis]